MPPKKDVDSVGDEKLKTLAVALATATELKLDKDAIAEAIGMSGSKNIYRKLDTILNPVGYKVKAGIVVKLDESEAPTTPKALKEKASPAKKNVSPSKKSPKKRKIEEVKDEKDSGIEGANDVKEAGGDDIKESGGDDSKDGEDDKECLA